MKIYLAPLQGLTDWIFRESYVENIGYFDKTFSPFIRLKNGEFNRPAQVNDILTVNNQFQCPIPQFLGNDILSFQRFESLCKEQGYSEININMGCPFPLVTGKGLGAGILAHPVNVASLLEEIFTFTSLKISIKCRLGQLHSSEFETLIPIFNSYPLEEIIIHPRLGNQQYKGEPDLQSFGRYAPQLKSSVCYNGDIKSVNDVDRVLAIYPDLSAIMIGRGLLRNPFLLAELKQVMLSRNEKMNMLLNFHTSILNACKQKYGSDIHILKRFDELWEYHQDIYPDGRKIYKKVKKARNIATYESAIMEAIHTL